MITPRTGINIFLPRRNLMAGNKVDKVLVTNQAALHAKYGSTGVKAIQKAVKRLIAADKKRGLKSVAVLLDDRDAMTEAGGKAVTDAKDPKQNKGAIDAVYKALAPDYLLVLGAEDVVPHQNLQNAMYHPGDPDPDADRDRVAWGDIPYACEAPYSRNPRKFFGATRVVGRLPDLVGARNPSYLLGLLGTASTRKQFAANSYRPYFGISAEIWKGSTAHSLTNAFGNAADLKTVPASKPKWPRSLLKRRSHFINCHGTRDNSMFYGQPASGESDYPVALDAAYVKGKITEGTVVAAEACYGAQLFDPARNDGQ